MYSGNLFEMAKVQMTERQQHSLAAYRMQAGLSEQAQPHALRRFIAALRTSIADSLHYVRTTPDPLHVAVEPASRRVIV